MQEKDIEKKLRIGIKGIGGLCLKWVSPGYTGVPDRMILLPGGIIRFAELKAPGKTERKRQIVVQRILRRMGFIVYNSVKQCHICIAVRFLDYYNKNTGLMCCR